MSIKELVFFILAMLFITVVPVSISFGLANVATKYRIDSLWFMFPFAVFAILAIVSMGAGNFRRMDERKEFKESLEKQP